MNRKECEYAVCGLGRLIEICYWDESIQYQEILMELIKEHFDNPPLKLDEIEPKMWVWDNLVKKYYQITSIDEINNVHIYHTSWLDGIFPAKYDEDRFYRKQVEE